MRKNKGPNREPCETPALTIFLWGNNPIRSSRLAFIPVFVSLFHNLCECVFQET